MEYTKEQIQAALIILESIEIHGYENAKRIVMLRNILDNGKEVKK